MVLGMATGIATMTHLLNISRHDGESVADLSIRLWNECDRIRGEGNAVLNVVPNTSSGDS